jgi:hypothetical protein
VRPSIVCPVEAFVVDAANFENDSDLAALGQKRVRADKAVEIDLRAERAGLAVVLEDSAKPEHGGPAGPEIGLNFMGSYCGAQPRGCKQETENLRIGLRWPSAPENRAERKSAVRRASC